MIVYQKYNISYQLWKIHLEKYKYLIPFASNSRIDTDGALPSMLDFNSYT